MNDITNCIIENTTDENGNPAGGHVHGHGMNIDWQNGPLGRGAERIEPNGAFVETVISAALQRIEYYQAGKFACIENAEAIAHLRLALAALNSRTNSREIRQVEGTHTV